LSVPSVADPDHIDADPDPDPDPAFHFDPDPDPTFLFDPDPDSTSHLSPYLNFPMLQNGLQGFHLFSLMGIRIRIQLPKKIRIRNTVCPFGGFFHQIKVRQPKGEGI
jgi:hypothetical protein